MRVQGYAALFAAPDLTGDVVRAGAFRASLARLGHTAPMLLEHDLHKPCGRWRAAEDSRGLFVDGEIDETLIAGRAAARLIHRGVDGLSIGFRARRSVIEAKGRTLIEIDLLEVSIVTLPMQPRARLSLVPGELRPGVRPAALQTT